MKMLQDEVREMKKLMNNLKQGKVIGEMFKQPMSPNESQNDVSVSQSIKAQRLEDLKQQRQTVDVSGRHSRLQSNQYNPDSVPKPNTPAAQLVEASQDEVRMS
jgi:DNA-binding transcriptional regulator LsrR (DeoR family)